MRLFQILPSLLLFTSPLLYATDYFGPTNLTETNANTIKITGPADLKRITADSVTVIGPLNFEEITVKQQLKVVGPVEGIKGDVNELNCMGWASLKKTRMNTLIVTGRIDGEEIEVVDQSNVTGILDVTKGRFKDITITSSLIKLKNSAVESIHIQKNKVEKETPVLMLLDSSIVNGDVVFESQNGKVIMDKSSKINGLVKGGKIEVNE